MFSFLIDLFERNGREAQPFFDKLPDELHVEIFKRLDNASLRKANHVCKK